MEVRSAARAGDLGWVDYAIFTMSPTRRFGVKPNFLPWSPDSAITTALRAGVESHLAGSSSESAAHEPAPQLLIVELELLDSGDATDSASRAGDRPSRQPAVAS